jgi:archaellum component FlaD/FlaE/archaellum component FlaC
MGVMDWLTGTDSSESDHVATDGLGFDDEMDDFDDGMDDFDDGGFDDGGFDDGSGGGADDFDDGMGGFDDSGGGMDDLDGGGLDNSGGGLGGGDIDADTIAEMEDRISELENEISSTTSEMNTVREENKQIGETVEELDDTVRKLLDIYEMVTRGINPFVDDAREMGGLENEGAFGLFEMEEESEDALDSEVAEADAEAFFDEDFGDIDAEEDEAELAAGDELVDDEREDPAATLDEDVEEDDVGGDDADDAGGGTSFDDLKSEYEENGGWDDVEDGEENAAESELDAAVEEDPFDADGIDDPDADDADVDGAFDAEDHEPESGGDEASGDGVDPADDGAFVQPDPVDPVARATATPAEAADGDAYLARIPPQYTAESVVMEWTQFLVEVGGVVGATRALRQYREQGWITRRVERTVGEHVRNAAAAGGTEGTCDLRIRDHRESLTYISRLAGDVEKARLLEELTALGGDARGIRR